MTIANMDMMPNPDRTAEAPIGRVHPMTDLRAGVSLLIPARDQKAVHPTSVLIHPQHHRGAMGIGDVVRYAADIPLDHGRGVRSCTLDGSVIPLTTHPRRNVGDCL